jgi:hypothetical protein
MQLVGNKFDDTRVLRASRAYELAHPFAMPDAAVVRGAGRTARAGNPIAG